MRRCIHLTAVVGISLLFFVIVDVAAGNYLLRLAGGQKYKSQAIERAYRIPHPYYHHTLRAGYRGKGIWGNKLYDICVNNFGFKTSCKNNGQTESKLKFDVVFMGDSFTEAVGLAYEQSFVGIFARKKPGLSVANMGVISYSPSVYLAKMRHFINAGLKTKHVVVHVDISDMHNEAVIYVDCEGGRVGDSKLGCRRASTLRKLKRQLPLTAILYDSAKELLDSSRSVEGVVKPANGKDAMKLVYGRNIPGVWTYTIQSPDYGAAGVKGAIAKSKRKMEQLYQLLKAHGISLSIAVYPWPNQLLFDREENLQVKVWREFCKTRCANFINSFPSFFAKVKRLGVNQVITGYYWRGDVHFNRRGNKILANDLIRAFDN